MLRNRLYILFLLLAQFAFTQQVNVFNIVRTGNFNACSPNPNPTITAEIIDGDGSSVVNGELVVTDPCGYTTLRITMNNLRYYQPNANWPHGFFFPTGDNITVANVTLPAGWIAQNSCTGASCSAQDTGGVGFYFDANASSSCCNPTMNDGDPSNNYGQSSMDCSTPFLIAFDMTFCNSKIETEVTEFTLQGSSDGNTGCWSSPDLNTNKVTFSINTVESDIILFDPAPINTDVITTCNNNVMNYLVELTGGCGNDNEITWWTDETGGTMLGSGSPFIYDAPGATCPEGTIIYAQCCPQGTICDSRVPVVVGPCSPPSDTPTFNPIPPQCIDGENPLPSTSIEGYTGTWSPVFDPTTTTTYIFTPDEGQCATEPATLEVIIEERITPTFTAMPPICQNGEIPDLPDSLEGIQGSWSPSIIDVSTPGTFSFIFTPEEGSCALETTIDITVNPEPVITQITTPLEFCTNSTTTYDFDLTVVEADLATNPTDYIFTYYETLEDAEVPQNNITVPAAYPVSVTTPTTVYIRVEDAITGCFIITEITIQPGQGVTLTAPANAIELCDDNFDGLVGYNLTQINNQLINPTTGLTFEYYASQQDYLDDNPIPTTQISNYQFSLPASIWVVATTSDECRSEPVEVDFIEGQAISLLAGPYEIPFCEGESVDLTAFQNIYTSETGIIFSYYEDISNAENGSGSIITITNYIPSGVGTTIFVRIVKADGSLCPQIVEVEFIAGQEVLHNPGPFGPIEYCEDETVDITSYTTSMANESGVTLSYYNSISDAQNAINPIPDETVFDPAGNGIVYVRLEKADRCVVVLELPYEQLPSPEILSVPSQLVICEGQETIELTAESDDPNAAFQWSWGNNQAYSGATITITETGIYTLTVIGSNGCRSIQEIDVRPGGEPIITSIESGDTYLIVFAQPGGGGTLEYSLNGVLWQTSPRFDGLVKGQTYTVYVREDGCLVKSHSTVILDAPNFISPNGDGYNDLWSIRGIEATPSATIKVFDRYGKIFVDTNFEGNYIWDGKYGRRPVPSGDYWYILEVPSDGVTIPKKFVGHISVRN